MTISKRVVLKNVVYTALGKGTTLVCIGVTSSIVARNLSPSDYGVVGFAGIIIGFLSHFSDVGVASAAIRRTSLGERDLRIAFGLKIILGLAAFVAAYLLAPLAHHFFEHPATVPVIRVLAINFVVSTIGFMPLVRLTREQNYRALVLPGILSVIVRSIIAITLVMLGWKYWAVVLADVGAVFVSSFAVQFARHIPLGLDFDLQESKDYLLFGIPLLGSALVYFTIFNIDNFLVGTKLGTIQLGYYALAFTWGSFICGLLYDTVNNVLFPAYSAIQHDIGAMRRWYLKTIDVVGFISVIANGTLLANAHYFLVTFLGRNTNKWIPATRSLQILCFYGIARSLTEPIANCIMVADRTRVLLQATLLAGAIEVGLLIYVLRTGRIELVALVVLLAYMSQAIIYLPFLRTYLGVTRSDLVARLWPILPALVGGYLLTSILPSSLGTTMVTLAVRAGFSALALALIYGICTRFRFFQEAGEIILQSLSRTRA